jgi:hypothetical protein
VLKLEAYFNQENMLLKIGISFLLIIISFSAQAQEKSLDTTALRILDRMSGLFGEIKSLGFVSKVSRDAVYEENFFIKEFLSSKVIMAGPNKFSVRIQGEGREDLYSYNGSNVSYYSFKDNIFTKAEAPNNLIETLDWLYSDFDIELTTADILYPSFSQELAETMKYIRFLGVTMLEGERVFHIGCANDAVTIQLWIKDDAYFLPKKTLITYLNGPYARQDETDFSEWVINQEYPQSIFEFMPPPGARQITWLKKN